MEEHTWMLCRPDMFSELNATKWEGKNDWNSLCRVEVLRDGNYENI